MKRKKQPKPEVVRLANCTAQAVPGYTITHLSEADLRQLHAGSVPAWIHDTVAFWLRDNPKPGDVDPRYQTLAEEQAQDAAKDVA